jgi:hypothetical protein
MSLGTDLVTRLVAQGVGVLGTSLFMSSKAVIPAGNGPYTTVSELGGVGPTRIQNKAGAATQRPTAQVLTRAMTESVARAKAWEAYQALDGIFNTTIGTTFYLRIVAKQEPTDMGLDGAGRIQFVFNVETEKQPT